MGVFLIAKMHSHSLNLKLVLKQQLWLLLPFTGIAQWSEACVGSGNPAPHTAGMGKAAWHHPSTPPVLPPQYTVLQTFSNKQEEKKERGETSVLSQNLP